MDNREKPGVGSHPVNLGFRFILELAALLALALWGSRQAEGVLSLVLALGVPALAATIWAVFRVPGDSSASGKAPVPVPGILRLALELGFFAFAAWAFTTTVGGSAALVFGGAVLVHYALSYDRLKWLVRA